MDRAVGDAERIELIRALEELKAAAAAAQARVSAGLYASVAAARAARGVPAAERGRGVAAQVALARRESPSRGSRHLGLARALTGEMPHTLAALTAGRLSEWRATLLVRETACLAVEDRRRVDRELCADPDTLEGKGDRALVAAAKRVAY
ncbi:MAG TPA: HNH endonuclease, partial [Actinomycetes bacterium]|nr:HNH endonuclease [Actinomycetes bacterium]